MGNCNSALSVLAPSLHSVPGHFVNNVPAISRHLIYRIADVYTINLERKGKFAIYIKKVSRRKSCLLGSHHWILNPRPLCTRFELKLLLPAYQERYRLYPCPGNTHSHMLQPFFCQIFLVSFGNCYKAIIRSV